MPSASKTYQFFFLLVIALALTGCEKPTPLGDQTGRTLNIIIMDPLSGRLACDCVLGYAQRKYDLLGKFLEKKLDQKVWIRYGESLLEILRLNPGRIDLIIGKSSIVKYDAGRVGASVHPIAALTDKTGTTKLTGLFVVRKNDKAKSISDLKGYRIILGPEWETEKSTAAINALKLNGVSIPKDHATMSTCNTSALAVVENDADAAVISSYTLALMEGCSTIDKGHLKVVGNTEEVDFITVFAADDLTTDDQDRIVKALLSVKDDSQLLERMESLNGFIKVDQKNERNDLAASWPDWRGPNRDALTLDTPVELPKKAVFLWRKPLTGVALSGIAATKKYVIVADKDKNNESDIFRCLDADTGDEIWDLTYQAAGDMDYSNSPRANPVIYQNMVYTLGAFGDLHCVNLENGKIIWKMNIFKNFGAELLTWGSCSTPLIADGKIIINPGAPNASIVALDLQTGKTLWKTPGRIAAYASFIVGTFGNVRQIVGYDAVSVGGWDIKTGKRLWELIPPEDYDFNVPTPVNVDGNLLLTTENNGTRLYGFDDNGKILPKPLAKNDDLAPDSQTPVVLEGLAFGSFGGKLFCLDVKDNLKTLWSEQQDEFYEYQSLIAGNGHVLIINSQGDLILVEANRDRYSLKSHLKLFDDTEVWSHPALIGNRIYIRNKKEICCILLESPPSLIEPLRPYVSQIVTEIEKVLPERKNILDQIADDIVMRLKNRREAWITFICSNNSRRSHMSQLWAQTAAYYYGLNNVHSFSGGTNATACNTRTVSALRRAGFSIVSTTQEDNPVYLIQFSNHRPPMRAYSKLYDTGSNPKEDFIALMCCSKADKTCPVIFGATSRYAIHYVDPKDFDETTEEISVYNERCREIAREMFYIMSHVRDRLNKTF